MLVITTMFYLIKFNKKKRSIKWNKCVPEIRGKKNTQNYSKRKWVSEWHCETSESWNAESGTKSESYLVPPASFDSIERWVPSCLVENLSKFFSCMMSLSQANKCNDLISYRKTHKAPHVLGRTKAGIGHHLPAVPRLRCPHSEHISPTTYRGNKIHRV